MLKTIQVISKVFVLSFFVSIQALIIESPSLEILKHISLKNALLVWDVDNTLIEPKSAEGSDQWFCALMDRELKAGVAYKTALAKWLPVYNDAQRKATVSMVEPTTDELIKKFQSDKVPMIALTYRSDELNEVIVKQLSSVGIDLSVTAPTKETFEVKHEESQAKPTCFYKGVMLCNGNDKGQILKLLLKKLNYIPELVVCVDDKMKYLVSIQNALEELSIKFVGIRYSYLDEKIRSFKLI